MLRARTIFPILWIFVPILLPSPKNVCNYIRTWEEWFLIAIYIYIEIVKFCFRLTVVNHFYSPRWKHARHGKASNTLTRKERRVYFLIYENTLSLIIYETSIYRDERESDGYIYIYIKLVSLFPDLRTSGPPKVICSVFAWKTERRNKTANIRGCATPTNDNKFDCPANGNAREF